MKQWISQGNTNNRVWPERSSPCSHVFDVRLECCCVHVVHMMVISAANALIGREIVAASIVRSKSVYSSRLSWCVLTITDISVFQFSVSMWRE